ncbi:TetR/AcrR family transcriptional regulator [Glutamicibacter sp. NPDC087344]|uniref:TetR/AcrR family transcriptional regulator n=1 Tax=Glutamicibacter sp. NPDC087344 TaxID=3363994 RepID=UPI0038036A7C
MARSKRGSYTVGLERRERILEAASQRFTSSGYSRTSLAEIARDVGITTPGLTHHFPTKQHLLLAIAERRFDVAQSIAEAALGELDGTRTLRVLLSLSELFAEQPGLMELFVLISAEAADPNSPAHELFQERYTRIATEIATFFMAEVASGALRPDLDYQAIARECIAVSDGLQLQYVLSEGKLDLVGQSRAHLERLASSILLSGGEKVSLA